ncbi:6-phospho-3-hexuloisomerase [Lentilactobacillus kefiri]|jgi:6-phospho-3-hexuloisomerase|uniref:6-phospho 3-hexuloisomerase n=2 Tax=Lentilactobacillus kefiri TaxID=33962 RepID=A0A511DT85_LENKE|nr:6-phospho-3-hexuloisomerase [Lentilactobacillus kefiri]MCJ2161082.1 6-phospho-3-hexuloisomerase [Lentilactobacillus kefiri]MCP9369381.1 6-phospho-3-hexuloisomerase [Lentilactobacillus kefiri]MDM7493561.1 6-phospho-3-hexuloisomerase [Lentilactobacillus kefiri]PAK59939.1 6-phospho-3-hexuloisomerase [Lentilactobacillus kefiri]PAK83878.1 6-phospho-3-hexuloisomerase [Lentilactobacillus kefiri]
MTLINDVMHEVNEVMGLVKEDQIDDAEKVIQKDRRIFVLGAGRSGLMAKGFAMRLMHIGYTVYVIGETITPSVQKGDVLVSVSGSGKTGMVVEPTEKAKADGVKIVAVTSNAESPLAKLGDAVIVVPGATKAGDGVKSIQLLSTLFDQSVHITLDVLCLKLSRRDHVSNDAAKAEHSNME